MQTIDISSFLEQKSTYPILDTRSPAEFENGHIPGAHSFPLFQNNERTEVGTTYKQKGRKKAIKKGLSIVGPQLNEFIEKAESFNSKTILMHCWRGGMRSQSLAWLLDLYGFDVRVLEGGYKSYRNEMLRFFSEPVNLKILSGATGSLKTEILKQMKKTGAQVVDLEGHANHMGSSFGNVMSTGQPTTEQFQNDVFDDFLTLDIKQSVWIEDESFSIGKVNFPEPLFHQKQEAKHVLIKLPRERRIQVLVDQYGELDADLLIQATHGIERSLGKENTEAASQFIQNGQLTEAVDIILEYYDKAYAKSRKKKRDSIEETISFASDESVSEMAERLINLES